MNSVEKEYVLYCHENKSNGKKYFGITSSSLYMRFRNGRGYQKQIFGKAIEKYGWDGFNHVVLIEHLSHDTACEFERYLIAKYNTTNPQYGYNITNGGEGHACIPTEESNRKRSEATSGEKHWHYGQKWSKEVIAKLHKPHPSIAGDNSPSKREEVRQKMAEIKKQWWKEHPDFKSTPTNKHTKAAKLKISKANGGCNNGNYGKRWFNNGQISVMAYECPEGFTIGRLSWGKQA